jgi:hypothetical protein
MLPILDVGRETPVSEVLLIPEAQLTLDVLYSREKITGI